MRLIISIESHPKFIARWAQHTETLRAAYREQSLSQTRHHYGQISQWLPPTRHALSRQPD